MLFNAPLALRIKDVAFEALHDYAWLSVHAAGHGDVLWTLVTKHRYIIRIKVAIFLQITPTKNQ